MRKLSTANSSFFTLILFIFVTINLEDVKGQIPDPIWGFTIDNAKELYEINWSFQTFTAGIAITPTARIVFDTDENDPFDPNPEDYEDIVTSIDSFAYTMGEILDSYEWSSGQWTDCIQGNDFDYDSYMDRLDSYINNVVLNQRIDIWEIGNEINLPWINGGDIDATQYIISDANAIVQASGYQTALTLFYYPTVECVDDCNKNPNLHDNSDYMMLNWAESLVKAYPDAANIDYIFVSYYADAHFWCSKDPVDWVPVFEDLHKIFPNAKLGFGECGYDKDNPPSQQEILDLIDEFYGMGAPLTNLPYFTRGYFWWYYVDDCLPYLNNVYWDQMYDNINAQNRPVIGNNNIESIKTSNFPNPFNPTTIIRYYTPKSANIKIVVYDNVGREVKVLFDGYSNKGNHNVIFNGESLASGVYYYKITSNDFTETKKILLVK
jgi:hypothetical protein